MATSPPMVDQPVSPPLGGRSPTLDVPIGTSPPTATAGVDQPASLSTPLDRTVQSPHAPIDTVPVGQSGIPRPEITSSESNVEGNNIPISVIIESLRSLQGTSLDTKIPYLSQVVDLLIQVLTNLDAVAQRMNCQRCMKCMNVVYDTLMKVALLVRDVGRMCIDEAFGLLDLPRGLEIIFQSFKSELDTIKDALKRRNEIGTFKAVFFVGAYLIGRIKKYIRMMSKALREFQVTLAFDRRFIAIAKQIKLTFPKVNARFGEGQTPLHIVSQLGQIDVIRTLIERKAEANAENDDKETPLLLVARNGNKDATELLLESDANVNHQDMEGRTPLQLASESGHDTVAQSLLNHQANVDAKNTYKWTALHLASRTGTSEVVQALLRSGADVNMPNDSGWTALHIASEQGHGDIIKLLLSNGPNVNVNTQEERGETALHLAAYYGHVTVAELLTTGDHRADPNIRNKDGKAPLDLARSEDHQGVVQLLEPLA